MMGVVRGQDGGGFCVLCRLVLVRTPKMPASLEQWNTSCEALLTPGRVDVAGLSVASNAKIQVLPSLSWMGMSL